MHTQLESELQSLQARRAEIARQLADAKADEQSARDAVIAGAAANELQAALARVATLEDVAAALDHRIEEKERDLQTALAKEVHVQAVELVKGQTAQWKTACNQSAEKGAVAVAAVVSIFDLMREFVKRADEHNALVELAISRGLTAEEAGLDFERINAFNFIQPLMQGQDPKDYQAIGDLFQHYARFVAVG